MTDSTHILILPKTPLHYQLLQRAILAKDQHALEAMRGNAHKPIHYITNWLYYYLLSPSDHINDSEVVQIWSPSARKNWKEFLQETNDPDPDESGDQIPLDTYDFLD